MNREAAAALSLYGAAHLVVDAVCAAAVMQLPVMQTVPSGDFIAFVHRHRAGGAACLATEQK